MALFKMRGFPKFDFKSEKPENTQEDRPNPTYEGTDEYRDEKDISTKEKSKRGVA